MTFLPIVERELRVRARGKGVYSVRVMAAGLAIVTAGVLLLFGLAGGGASRNAGKVLYTTLSMLAFCFCFFEALRQASDALSAEKREGTIGLLFLTDLKGYDVVLGKMAAISLNSFYALVGVLPVLAMSLLLGGVTGGQFWQMSLVLTNTLFFAMSAGMWVSAGSWHTGRAWSGTLGVMLLAGVGLPGLLKVVTVIQGLVALWGGGAGSSIAFWVLEPLVWLGRASPVVGFYGALSGTAVAGDFWRAFVATQILSWLFLLAASRRIRWNWQVPPGPARPVVTPTVDSSAAVSSGAAKEPMGRGGEVSRRSTSRILLDVNPVAWLVLRGGQVKGYAWLIALAATGVSGLVGMTTASLVIGAYVLWPFKVLLTLGVAFQACRFFVESRQSGLLEMLVVTPVKWADVLRGQVAALKRVFFRPALTLWCGSAVLSLVPFVFLRGRLDNASWVEHGFGAGMALFAWAYAGVSIGVGILATFYVGMYVALRRKTLGGAVGYTVLWAVLLPKLGLCCVPIVVDLIVELVMLLVARDRLLSRSGLTELNQDHGKRTHSILNVNWGL